MIPEFLSIGFSTADKGYFSSRGSTTTSTQKPLTEVLAFISLIVSLIHWDYFLRKLLGLLSPNHQVYKKINGQNENDRLEMFKITPAKNQFLLITESRSHN